MDLAERLGLNLRDLRRARGLTQEEIAHRAELERSYISDLERGRRNPSVKALDRLAAALNVDPCRLLEPREARPAPER